MFLFLSYLNWQTNAFILTNFGEEAITQTTIQEADKSDRGPQDPAVNQFPDPSKDKLDSTAIDPADSDANQQSVKDLNPSQNSHNVSNDTPFQDPGSNQETVAGIPDLDLPPDHQNLDAAGTSGEVKNRTKKSIECETASPPGVVSGHTISKGYNH